jgi:hypothetical protein
MSHSITVLLVGACIFHADSHEEANDRFTYICEPTYQMDFVEKNQFQL